MNKKLLTTVLLCILVGVFIYGIIDLVLPEVYDRRRDTSTETEVTTATNLSNSDSYDTPKSGWSTSDGRRIYRNEDGSTNEGWKKIDGTTYYFKKDGSAVTGSLFIDGATRYFSDSGKLLTGWNRVNGKNVYLNSDGSLHTGWLTLLGEKYYLYDDGTPARGVVYLNDKYMTFNDKGVLITKDFLLSRLSEVPEPDTSSEEAGNANSYAGSLNVKALSLVGMGNYDAPFSDRKIIFDTIKEVTENDRYSISFVAMDLYTGDGITYNIDQKYYSASAIKGPYIAALTEARPEMIEKNERTMTEIIMNSDNKLYSSYRRTYGREFLLDLCEELDINEPSMVYNYPHISARDMAKFWITDYYYFNADANGAKIKHWYESPNQSPIFSVYSLRRWYSISHYRTSIYAGSLLQPAFRP